MRRSLFSLVGIFAIAASAFAAPAKPREAWASGQIERFDASARSLVVKQGTHEMTFVLGPGVQVVQGKTEQAAADLAKDVGRQAKVRYTTNGGSRVAERIEVGGQMAPHAARPATKK